MGTMVVAVEREKREKCVTCFGSNDQQYLLVNWTLGGQREEKMMAERYCFSNGQMSLSFFDPGKTRRGATCARPEGNKPSVLSRLRLGYFFKTCLFEVYVSSRNLNSRVCKPREVRVECS